MFSYITSSNTTSVQVCPHFTNRINNTPNSVFPAHFLQHTNSSLLYLSPPEAPLLLLPDVSFFCSPSLHLQGWLYHFPCKACTKWKHSTCNKDAYFIAATATSSASVPHNPSLVPEPQEHTYYLLQKNCFTSPQRRTKLLIIIYTSSGF